MDAGNAEPLVMVDATEVDSSEHDHVGVRHHNHDRGLDDEWWYGTDLLAACYPYHTNEPGRSTGCLSTVSRLKVEARTC